MPMSMFMSTRVRGEVETGVNILRQQLRFRLRTKRSLRITKIAHCARLLCRLGLGSGLELGSDFTSGSGHGHGYRYGQASWFGVHLGEGLVLHVLFTEMSPVAGIRQGWGQGWSWS